MLSLLTITIGADAPVPILGRAAAPVGFVVVNIGGLDAAGALPGPDDAYLYANQGDDFPAMFTLLSGAALAFPGDLSNLYAAAVTSTTTLTVAFGTRP